MLSLLFCSVILVNIMAFWSLQVRKRSVLLGIGSGVARKKKKGEKKKKQSFYQGHEAMRWKEKKGPTAEIFCN